MGKWDIYHSEALAQPTGQWLVMTWPREHRLLEGPRELYAKRPAGRVGEGDRGQKLVESSGRGVKIGGPQLGVVVVLSALLPLPGLLLRSCFPSSPDQGRKLRQVDALLHEVVLQRPSQTKPRSNGLLWGETLGG